MIVGYREATSSQGWPRAVEDRGGCCIRTWWYNHGPVPERAARGWRSYLDNRRVVILVCQHSTVDVDQRARRAGCKFHPVGTVFGNRSLEFDVLDVRAIRHDGGQVDAVGVEQANQFRDVTFHRSGKLDPDRAHAHVIETRRTTDARRERPADREGVNFIPGVGRTVDAGHAGTPDQGHARVIGQRFPTSHRHDSPQGPFAERRRIVSREMRGRRIDESFDRPGPSHQRIDDLFAFRAGNHLHGDASRPADPAIGMLADRVLVGDGIERHQEYLALVDPRWPCVGTLDGAVDDVRAPGVEDVLAWSG